MSGSKALTMAISLYICQSLPQPNLRETGCAVTSDRSRRILPLKLIKTEAYLANKILPSFTTKLSLNWTTKVREYHKWPILTMVGTSVRMRQRHQCQGRPSSPNQSRQINSYNESNLNDFYTAMVSSHAREVLRYIRKGCTR